MKQFILGVVCGVLAVAAFGGAQMTGTFSTAVGPVTGTTINTPGTLTSTEPPTIEDRLVALESRVAALEKQKDYLDEHCGPDEGNGFRECW